MHRSLPLLFLLLLLLPAAPSPAGEAPRYAVAFLPTPVLNTPDFAGVFGGRDGKSLRTDSCGQIRALEFVAFPATLFRIEETIRKGNSVVYRVTTDDYPYPDRAGYFIDNRFVGTVVHPPANRPRSLPSRENIVESLLAAEGSAYVWGGNLRGGIPEMLAFFPEPSQSAHDQKTSALRQLRGVDCSGLLYEATTGFTPRNSSGLVDFGAPVPVAGTDATGIAGRLEPLDLIAWPGHVLIVLDRERVIESRLDCTGRGGGVRVRSLAAALREIMKSRVPVDDYRDATARRVKGFVVRRWYPTSAPAASTLPQPAFSGTR